MNAPAAVPSTSAGVHNSFSMTPTDAAALLRDADLCVKCGLCLPHCPTYALNQHEADSPRGRVTLIQGFANGTLALTPNLHGHLDGCLSCRACEAVCPPKVPFGRLMDQARAATAPQRPLHSGLTRMFASLLVRPQLRSILFSLLWLYQRLPLSNWLRRWHWWAGTRLGRMEALLPPLRRPQSLPRLVSATERRVQLFTGCTGAWLDGDALRDTVSVLGALGYAVDIPPQQRCCGALHQHAGLRAEASALAQNNLDTFRTDLPILSFASGCGATLRDYADLVDGGASFAVQVQDVNDFVLRHWPADLQLKPLRQRLALHSACTQTNVLRSDAAVLALMQKIPDAEVLLLDATARCCGAAGANMITDPDTADVLRQRKLDLTEQLKPGLMVSGNIGCSLHLAAGLRQAGLSCEVRHPMSVLAHCLQAAPSARLQGAASAVPPARPE